MLKILLLIILYSLLIDSTTASLAYLKKMNTPGVDRKMDAINNGAQLWEDVLRQAPVTEAEIIPVTKIWAAKTQDKMIKYGRTIKRLQWDFKDNALWTYAAGPNGPTEARRMMDEMEKLLIEEKKTLDANVHLCSIFG